MSWASSLGQVQTPEAVRRVSTSPVTQTLARSVMKPALTLIISQYYLHRLGDARQQWDEML